MAACSSPKSYTAGHGTHTFRVRATDLTGNVGAETTFTWTVDTVAPARGIVTCPFDVMRMPPLSYSYR